MKASKIIHYLRDICRSCPCITTKLNKKNGIIKMWPFGVMIEGLGILALQKKFLGRETVSKVGASTDF